MKIAVRILYGLLLVALLLTTIELLRWVLPISPNDNIDPDMIKFESLATLMLLVVYFFAVFLEIELFVGLRCLLLGIERKKTLMIVFSCLLLFSTLAEGILVVLADTYSKLGRDFTVWLLAVPVVMIVLDFVLCLAVIICKKHNRIDFTDENERYNN